MIQIPFPFFPSTLLPPSMLFLILSLSFVPAIRSEPNLIQLPSDHGSTGGDPCREWESERAVSSSCPVKCFRTDPVCGVDGVTYWCGCGEARCAGAKVAKLGFCEVRNNGAAAQALLLLHIVWLIVLGLSLLFGLF